MGPARRALPVSRKDLIKRKRKNADHPEVTRTVHEYNHNISFIAIAVACGVL
jgi:hypothetical protein